MDTLTLKELVTYLSTYRDTILINSTQININTFLVLSLALVISGSFVMRIYLEDKQNRKYHD